MQLKIFCRTFLALAMALFSISASALSISGGTLALNLDANALASMGSGVISGGNPGSNTVGDRYVYVDDYFGTGFYNQAITGTSPTAVDSVAVPSTNLVAGINGASVVPVAGRSHKPTTLNFNSSLLDGTATGQIGTNGVIRISSDIAAGLAGAYLLWDDIAMDYTGGNWAMFTEDGFFGKNYLFDLSNLNETIVGNALTLTGDLSLATSWAGFLGANAGTNLGSFTLQTTVVPVPAAVWLFGSGLMGLLSIRRKTTAVS